MQFFFKKKPETFVRLIGEGANVTVNQPEIIFLIFFFWLGGVNFRRLSLIYSLATSELKWNIKNVIRQCRYYCFILC